MFPQIKSNRFCGTVSIIFPANGDKVIVVKLAANKTYPTELASCVA